MDWGPFFLKHFNIGGWEAVTSAAISAIYRYPEEYVDTPLG